MDYSKGNEIVLKTRAALMSPIMTILDTLYIRGGIDDVSTDGLYWAISGISPDLLSWTLNDSKGFSNDGLWSEDKTSNAISTRLVESQCAKFNGTDEYFLAPTTINNYPFTLCVVYVPVSTSGTKCIMDLAKSTLSNTNYGFYQLGTGLGVQCRSGGVIYIAHAISSVFVAGEKYTIMMEIADSENVNIYINNTTPVSFPLSTSPIVIGSVDRMGVGAFADSTPVSYNDGHFIFSAQYDRVLSEQEKNDIINLTNYPDDGPVYTFAEGAGSTIYDVSGNTQHGSIINPSGTLWDFAQDYFHANLINGFRLDTGVKIPALIDGTTAADGGAITNPADYWHNGAETKLIVGAQVWDGTGWTVNAEVKAADTLEFVHTDATGYGKPLGYADLVANVGDYLFCDVTEVNKYKNLKMFSKPQ